MKKQVFYLIILTALPISIFAQKTSADSCLEIEAGIRVGELYIETTQSDEIEAILGLDYESSLVLSIRDTADVTDSTFEFLYIKYPEKCLSILFSDPKKIASVSISDSVCARTKEGIVNGVSSLADVINTYGENYSVSLSSSALNLFYAERGIDFSFAPTACIEAFSDSLHPGLRDHFLLDPAIVPIEMNKMPPETLERTRLSGIGVSRAIQPVQNRTLIQGRRNVFTWQPSQKRTLVEIMKKNGQTTTRVYE